PCPSLGQPSALLPQLSAPQSHRSPGQPSARPPQLPEARSSRPALLVMARLPQSTRSCYLGYQRNRATVQVQRNHTRDAALAHLSGSRTHGKVTRVRP
ncbi:hypothetical protein Tco_0510165, partial [Tanacetum coccineum]